MSPKLTAEQKARWQADLTAAAASLRVAVEARSPLAIRLGFHSRVLKTVAKLVQLRLTMLKRDLKNESLTEQQIHQIIPDASKAKPRPAPAPDPVA